LLGVFQRLYYLAAGGREAVYRAVAALKHPNIVTIYSVEEADTS
jgi:hypothetical protein